MEERMDYILYDPSFGLNLTSDKWLTEGISLDLHVKFLHRMGMIDM